MELMPLVQNAHERAKQHCHHNRGRFAPKHPRQPQAEQKAHPAEGEVSGMLDLVDARKASRQGRARLSRQPIQHAAPDKDRDTPEQGLRKR
jgi:hypothetical protein